MIRGSKNHGRQSHLDRTSCIRTAFLHVVYTSYSMLHIASIGLIHTHEEIIRIRWIAANSEELHEIMKLPVNVATYLHT